MEGVIEKGLHNYNAASAMSRVTCYGICRELGGSLKRFF